MDTSRLSLNTATVPGSSLTEVIELAVSHGIPFLAPWRHLLEHDGAARAGAMVREAGLTLSSLCRGGMFTHPTAAGRAAAVDDNRRAVDEARAIGAPVLVLVCGPVVGGDVPGSYEMVRDGIGELLRHARDAGVGLGIEPLHPMMAADRSAISTLDDALDLITDTADGADRGANSSTVAQVGLIVDAYHVWWDRRLGRSLAAARDLVCGVHVSDWVSPLTGGLMSGRGMMGDGVIDLPALVAATGWAGPVEVEVISDTWAARPPQDVVATAVDRFRRHV